MTELITNNNNNNGNQNHISPHHLYHRHPSASKQSHKQQQQHQVCNTPNRFSHQQTTAIDYLTNNLLATPTSPATAQQSPLHYRNPVNSPNNTLRSPTTAFTLQQQLQQYTWNNQTQYQQHLTNLLLQQQHLHRQQQQLLLSPNTANDQALCEESVKQNVAIVLNNLNRYNNALRSVILTEPSNSTLNEFCDSYSYSSYNKHLLNNMAAAATPESDYNSNATTPNSRISNTLQYETASIWPNHYQQLHHQHHYHHQQQQQQQQQQHQHQPYVGHSRTNTTHGNHRNDHVGNHSDDDNSLSGNNLTHSLASSHDFIHDNSDYQWFLDYGYRDGCGGMQRSVLSSLSASYNTMGDGFYEDLSKNLDANLAEVDMESFRAEDIHLLLSHLPSYCKSLSGNRLQQNFVMNQQFIPTALEGGQQHTDTQQHQHMGHNVLQTSSTSSANDLIDNNSICKSELLFSPIKETHISVDSLDMDAYPDDDDIILTCKANKNNYTIAFEGSNIYSDDSFCVESNDVDMKNKQNCINLHSNLDDIVARKSLEMSMSRSEQPPSNTNSNRLLKHCATHTPQLQRYPSGNNNTTEVITIIRPAVLTANSGLRKSNSLPSLDDNSDDLVIVSQTSNCFGAKTKEQKLNVSQVISMSTMERNARVNARNLLPMCQMPISCNSLSTSIEEHLNQLQTNCRYVAFQQHQQQQQQHQQQQQQQLVQKTQQQPNHKCKCCCGGISNLSNNLNKDVNSQHLRQTPQHPSSSGSSSSANSNPAAFNLVKLFIKQKSSNCPPESQDSVHTCTNNSLSYWPSSCDANTSIRDSHIDQQQKHLQKNRDSIPGKEENTLSKYIESAGVSETATFPTDALLCSPKKSHVERSTGSSTGSDTITNSPPNKGGDFALRNPALSYVINENDLKSESSFPSSDNTSQHLTQISLTSAASKNVETKPMKSKRNDANLSRHLSHVSSLEMITRSMQTSASSLSTRSSLNDRLRYVPPSFLDKLNHLGEQQQAPIYVIYPNYALPDLGFVKNSSAHDVIFSPFNYKTIIGGGFSGDDMPPVKNRFDLMTNSEEDEILKTIDYKHVVDWTSLLTLLPAEYRKRLKHIPEVQTIAGQIESDLSHKPVFCHMPSADWNRTHICDCEQYFQRAQQTEAVGSSSSGSSQQPSSGYRGSSTMLTDSDLGISERGTATGDPFKQMYVYRYEQQRMDAGVEMHTKLCPNPQFAPKSILRKHTTTIRNKRNSMIEADAYGSTRMSKLEKRRSLQEPPYQHTKGSSEELPEVFEEDSCEAYNAMQGKTCHQRLSRKDMDVRMRGDNFLSTLPRSELKYYAEIVAILESSEHQVQYNSAALKREVSQALSQQKKVSFNDLEYVNLNTAELENTPPKNREQELPIRTNSKSRFFTPPNSPNISIANNTMNSTKRQQNGNRIVTPVAAPRNCSQRIDIERRKQEANRFKRLQIQWELISNDSTLLKELAIKEQTKSGGSTPTSAVVMAAALDNVTYKSRIPRPVSYPAGRYSLPTHLPRSCNNVNQKIQTQNSKPYISAELPMQSKLIKPKTKPITSTISPQIARLNQKGYPTTTKTTTKSPSRIVPPKRYSITIPLSPMSTNTTRSHSMARAATPNSRVVVTAPNTPRRTAQSTRFIPKTR